MRIVVLGGYGVFGFRLAQLLARDGHTLWLAGRSLEKAKNAAMRIQAKPLAIDRQGDLEPIFAVRPDVVIDAAGPFQSYGEDRYRVARRCIEQKADYLDLSDDADFTTGIAELDSAARKAGRRVLSGVSSVPGLSSAAVKTLSEGLDEILLIDTAILPGNKAPRGASVMTSILSQVGRRTRAWRGGIWRQTKGWTDRRRYQLTRDLARDGYFVRVPDIQLFPEAFGARSVVFRAGMELGILNAGLSVLGKLRRRWRLEASPIHIRLLQWLANCLFPFGSDRGGMQTEVTGLIGGAVRQRTWSLIAEKGEGPFVPGVVARALLRRLEETPAGARPCIGEVTLTEIEEAMGDLAVSVGVTEADRPTLFQSSLGDRWAALPDAVRELHSVQDMESFSGFAEVTRGRSILARIAAWILGFPPAGEEVPVTVTITRTDEGETWERNFAGRVFRSYCSRSPEPYRYRERLGLFTYELGLPVEYGRVRFPVRRGWILGVPVPRFLLPRSDTSEFALSDAFHFDVALAAPLSGALIVRYRGALTPDRLYTHKAPTSGVPSHVEPRKPKQQRQA